MSECYVGEVRLFAGSFAPQGWAFCDGSLLNINEYQLLFAVLGTTYGGDGRVTFALPNLKGRLVVGQGQGVGLSSYALGQTFGSLTVSLTDATQPSHSHTFNATTNTNNQSSPANGVYATLPTNYDLYLPKTTPSINNLVMDDVMCGQTGGGASHANVMPCMGLAYIIATNGVFPS